MVKAGRSRLSYSNSVLHTPALVKGTRKVSLQHKQPGDHTDVMGEAVDVTGWKHINMHSISGLWDRRHTVHRCLGAIGRQCMGGQRCGTPLRILSSASSHMDSGLSMSHIL